MYGQKREIFFMRLFRYCLCRGFSCAKVRSVLRKTMERVAQTPPASCAGMSCMGCGMPSIPGFQRQGYPARAESGIPVGRDDFVEWKWKRAA